MLQLILCGLGLLTLSRAIAQPRWRRPMLGVTLLVVLALGLSLPGAVLGQKVIGRLVMPAALLWLLLLLGALVYAQRPAQRRLGLALGAIALAYWAVGARPVGGFMMRQLQADFVVEPIERYPQLDALLVLGGGAGVANFDRVQLTSAGDRVAIAARLYHLGKARYLVTSGVGLPGVGRQVNLADITSKLWRQLGVPKSAIVEISEGYNTKAEMQRYARLIQERGWAKVGLVTSGYHMRRALASAERLQLKLVPIVADIRGVEMGAIPLQLIPQREGFWESQTAAWEFIGRLVRS